MLGFKQGRHGKHGYKPLSPEALEKQHRREHFITSPNVNVEKTLGPRTRKKGTLAYWLSSLRLYLSREGPALGPLPSGVDDLRKEQAQNHQFSQVILAYDLRAIELQNRLLLKHVSRKQTKSDDERLSRENTPEHTEDNVFDFRTPPGLNNYPAVDKTDSDESFVLIFPKTGEQEIAAKMVPTNMKAQLTKDKHKAFIQNRPLEGSSKDLLHESTEDEEAGGDSKQTLGRFDQEGRISNSPSSKLPRTPIPTPPKSGSSTSLIAQLREAQLQPKQSPLSKKDLRRNSKTADVNKKYYEGLQLSRKSNHPGHVKLISPAEKTTNPAGTVGTEERGASESSIPASRLTKEFTTPTLDPTNRPFFASGQRIGMERYSMQSVEGTSQDTSTNDVVVGFSPDEDAFEPLLSRANIPKPQQKLQTADSNHGVATDDEERVVFFDLEDSRPSSSGGGSLLHRSSSSISGSIKALRYSRRTGKKDHQR
ncbi:hypothetical protein PICMEDRAFT_14651 [Pichia membranifaciens NRRL Y-2026]|uniref:Uncharacterized protein n=1 Tax=Pichia membranifaciens NRRL Y-2026 TaxID=763406 RepID=A0A1E3NSP7_9ASCO|nr:hypothetical protein PICMEDRAFT_14651 [Pichia membranifaciens NRRL Y-2026]ODQ49177.1 hypothetical protein PICMEDRAFT_14651 [Pichia membranifaciens NRRL Y-2026]